MNTPTFLKKNATTNQWPRDTVRILRHLRANMEAPEILQLSKLANDNNRILLVDYRNMPGGSHKMLFVAGAFERAVLSGHLREGMTIIVPSSGNTGRAAGLLAKMLGLRCIVVLPEATSPRKIGELELQGTELIKLEDLTACKKTAEKMYREAPSDIYYFNQFDARQSVVPGNANIATLTMAALTASGIRTPNSIYCTSGTGVTAACFKQYARMESIPMTTIGVDVSGCNLKSAVTNGLMNQSPPTHMVEGIATGELPDSFNAMAFDGLMEVSENLVIQTCHYAKDHLGVDVGPTSALGLSAAMQDLELLDDCQHPVTLLVPLYDHGKNYSETVYCPSYLEARGISPVMEQTKIAA